MSPYAALKLLEDLAASIPMPFANHLKAKEAVKVLADTMADGAQKGDKDDA